MDTPFCTVKEKKTRMKVRVFGDKDTRRTISSLFLHPFPSMANAIGHRDIWFRRGWWLFNAMGQMP